MKYHIEIKILGFCGVFIAGLVLLKAALGMFVGNAIAAAVLGEAGMLAFALWLFRRFTVQDLPLRQCFVSSRKLPDFARGAGFGALLFACSMAVLLGTGALRLELVSAPLSSFVFKTLIMAAAVLFTAFWEETVFRAYILALLERKYGALAGAAATGAVFGLLHLLSPVKSAGIVAATFCSGMLLSYAFLRRRSVYYPAGIHFCWNFLTSFTGSAEFFRVTARTPLLAGATKVEEGLVVIAATAAAVFIMAGLYRSEMAKNGPAPATPGQR
ncbi:MAG TPA: type II CAAX endopeptidase family protein [Elusimicrobiales bacterium]|nr:type II CAAX endopeptidase family protein [Elusimicrobiales bacterium]